MSDGDLEVERPPSSYGAMCSDDPEDDEIQDAAPQTIIKVNLPTNIRLNRPDSPETAITSVTQDRRTSVHNEVVYITARRNEPEPGEVVMELEDNESYVLLIEPQNRERRTVQVEPSVPEPEPPPPLIANTHSEDERDLPFVFRGMLQSLRMLTAVELQCFVRTLCSQRKGQLGAGG